AVAELHPPAESEGVDPTAPRNLRERSGAVRVQPRTGLAASVGVVEELPTCGVQERPARHVVRELRIDVIHIGSRDVDVQRAARLGTYKGALRAALSRARKARRCEQTRSERAGGDREPESSSHGTPFLGQSQVSHGSNARFSKARPICRTLRGARS